MGAPGQLARRQARHHPLTLGFLHTAGGHVATFRALVADVAPGLDDVHVVDESLLVDARRRGVDADLRRRLQGRLEELAERGADLVICTCSTLGGEAELLDAAVAPAVMRVDRPMAEAAVSLGGRIAVVAAVASTQAPTRALLEKSARAAAPPVIVDASCLDAWALFEAGDQDAYLDRIAQAIRSAAADGADVIVLAQASMAAAADRVPDVAVPVLSSPRTAIVRAAALIGA